MLVEKLSNTCLEETNPSDDELELDGTGEVDSTGGGGVMAPPPYSELSCGMSEAAHYLFMAKMSFHAAHTAKPMRQADIRDMFG